MDDDRGGCGHWACVQYFSEVQRGQGRGHERGGGAGGFSIFHLCGGSGIAGFLHRFSSDKVYERRVDGWSEFVSAGVCGDWDDGALADLGIAVSDALFRGVFSAAADLQTPD